MWQAWVRSQWQQRGLISWVLRPASWLYWLVVTIREMLFRSGISKTFKPEIPVVVVGNIYVGGTGKTPVILSLIDALRVRGWHPGLVSRGYGAQASQDPVCGRGLLDARQVGDEPAMITLKTGASIAVHPDRVRAVQALMMFDPRVDVVLSDDGLQHWRLGRDVELLVQDERGIGNGLVLPAGPLREPASRMNRVQAILTRRPVGELRATRADANVLQSDFALKVGRFRHLQTGLEVCPDDFVRRISDPKDVLAVAGIGVPERFFADLRSLGVAPSRALALADHSHIDAAWLSEQPEQTILMTEKDAIKLGTSDPPKPLEVKTGSTTRSPVNPGSIRLGVADVDGRIWVGLADSHWADEAFFDWLDTLLHSLHAKH